MAARRKEPFSFLELARVLTAMFLGAVWLAKMATISASGTIEYASSEWLVSYAAGFIRRGLSGEIVLGAARLTGLDSMIVVKAVAGLSLLLFLWLFVSRIAAAPGLSRDERFFLMFMPAALPFIFLNGHAILRKDYLACLVFFGFLALLGRQGRFRDWPILLYLATAGSFAILVHEIFSFLFLPYAALLLFARLRASEVPPRQALLRLAGILAVPALVTLTVLAVQPAPGDLLRICEQAKPFTQDLECTPLPESFTYMELDRAGAIQTTYRELVQTRIWGLPAGIFWVAFTLPFAWLHFEVLCRVVAAHLGPERWRDARLTAFTLFLFNAVLVTGMSIVGFDIGRWVFLLTSLATISMTSAPSAIALANLAGPLALSGWEPRIPRINPKFYVSCILAAAFVSLIFRIKHCCVYVMVDWFWLVQDILLYLGVVHSVDRPLISHLLA
jgi:hypothetical protein